MSRFVSSRVLFALFLVALSVAIPASRQASQADELADALALTTTVATLDAGDYQWSLREAQTIPDDGPAQTIPTGFVVALENPLLLLADDDVNRIAANDALAIGEPLRARPLALLSDSPVAYLGIDLAEGATGPESFTVPAGGYDLSLWRLDLGQQVPAGVLQRLADQTMPMLVLVRSGAIDVPSPDGTVRTVEAGQSAILQPGIELQLQTGGPPPIVLIATLSPASDGAASPEASPNDQQAPPTEQPTEQATAEPSPTDQATERPTTEPTEEEVVIELATEEPTNVPAG